MRRPVVLLAALCALLFACKSERSASGGKTEPSAHEHGAQTEQPAARPGLFLCTRIKDDACVDPRTTFRADSAEIHVMLVMAEIPRGDGKGTITWIAEDVGDKAPPNYRIAASAVELGKAGPRAPARVTVHGTLTRPTAGWPVGKYRVEIQIEDQHATAGRFVITER